jgi:hypothetical protein
LGDCRARHQGAEEKEKNAFFHLSYCLDVEYTG